MDNQFISTRIINDVAPVMKKHGYTKYIDPEAFACVCKLYYDKILNNQQFKRFIETELEEVNKYKTDEQKDHELAGFKLWLDNNFYGRKKTS